jgi:RNA polymerase sigma-70 factor (ECF subfamily)
VSRGAREGWEIGENAAERIPWGRSNRRPAAGILLGVREAILLETPVADNENGSSGPEGGSPEAASFASFHVRRLVARAQAGDGGAFEQLYHLHLGRVYALCRRLCRDEAEAEELTQESFVRAFERLSLFRGESAFASWLHRLAVNVVLGKWRGQNRYRQRVLPLDDFESFEAPAPAAGDGTAIDLERAIAGLPKGARTVFVLYDIEGYQHEEIAEATGLAVGTSKAQLHRARRLMREALGYGDAR